MNPVKVIGAGLAGCEAAWQLAQRGIPVTLYEMKPKKMSPAHHSADFAELVCSNSLRGDRLENAVGLLKEELRRLDSLILRCAEATRVEAGGALAVDRYGFSSMVTAEIRNHPLITVVEEEVTQVPEGPVIIAMPGLPPAMTGGRRIMSTAPWMRRPMPPSSGNWLPPRRLRFTALRTAWSLRAACPWRSWPAVVWIPCATAP